MKERRVIYPISGGGAFTRVSDVTYQQADGEELKLDLYRPAGESAQLPAVVFIHGDGPPELIRDIKDWGQYVSWGELTASTGLAAITFNHRSSHRRTRMHEVQSDIESAFDFVTRHAGEWGLDASRIGLWTCSMGVPFALRLAFERASSLRCVAALYGPMDLTNDPGADGSVPQEARLEFSPLHHLRSGKRLPPLLLVRAGKDDPILNASIDEFVACALERNLEIDVLNHPTGEHGFDVLNDCPRSRAAIEAILGFYRGHLGSTSIA
jgi:acetyl esterase/lipase